MEDLLLQQKESFSDIDRRIKNYKHDGQSRKTAEYFLKKIYAFQEIWDSVKERHEILLTYATPEQPYFAENSYGTNKDTYDAIMSEFHAKYIEKGGLPINVGNIQSAESSNASPQQMNQQQANQQRTESLSNGSQKSTMLDINYNELLELIIDIDQVKSNRSIGYLKTHLDLMKNAWTEFRKTYLESKFKNDQEITVNFNEVQKLYVEACGQVNDAIQLMESSKNDAMNLPKLRLPEFDGKTTGWYTFIALFNKMVHDKPQHLLDDGIKMEYLKTCIKGSAAKLISHVEPTAENYKVCYDLLEKRYDNKREVLTKLLNVMLRLPKLKEENSTQLRAMHDTVHECTMTIQNMGIKVNEWDPILVHILLQKLNKDAIKAYELQLKNVKEPQKLIEFLSFIESRFMAMQSVENENIYNKDNMTQQSNNFNANKQKNQQKNQQKTCAFCNKNHSIMECEQFLSKTPSECYEIARNKKLCINCLSNSHAKNNCRSSFGCKKCKKRHNTLLHLDDKNVQMKEIAANMSEIQNEIADIDCYLTRENNFAMLATAMVGVLTKSGEKVIMRILIDQGSQASYISENALQTLKLSKFKMHARSTGIGENASLSKYIVPLKITPVFDSTYVLTTAAVVLKKVTNYSADLSKSNHSFDVFKNLRLADPNYLIPSKVDIVIGCVEHARIIKPGLVKCSPDDPIAQDTEFGWIVSGPVTTDNRMQQLNITSLVSNFELDNTLKSFFQEFDLEKIDEPMTTEEIVCEQHFVDTHSRNNDGRYVVRLPFKNGVDSPDLGESRKTAVASLMQLEKRFIKNPNLKKEYQNFINEYLELDHMECVPYNVKRGENVLIHYLPHHCVLKESTTTKLRVVFNASQKTSNGNSLNDTLAIGKAMQSDLITLLLNFRIFRYAFSADVEKMYRQILLPEDQKDLHRILWRNSPNEPILDYRLKTITYGTSNAPYLAIRTLKQLSDDVKDSFPKASNIIEKNMYMDDVLSGAPYLDELFQTYNELKSAFKSAGFNLRKWCSNSSELLQKIPENDRELKAEIENVKALGVSWSPLNDDFTYNYCIALDSKVNTKRQLASEIASLYDPLGWICPVVVKAKNLMQELWKQNIGWDESVPTNVVNDWQKIKNEICILNEISIPRWIFYEPNHEIELHGFCDASFSGFAAALYVKNVNTNKVALLIAKAKVAPKKEENKTTIPRLELSGAALLAELTNYVIKTMQIEFRRIYLWTDSKVVLGWINANPKRYKTFIANKICKINKVTDKRNWFHVSSENNPADCASRGIFPSELKNHPLWWNGPSFLTDKSFVYPTVQQILPDIELASLTAHVHVMNDSFLPRVSSYYKLKRVMALCLRFIEMCKHKKRIHDPISMTELRTAEKVIIKTIQKESFESEISELNKDKSISKNNKLIRLTPFLDGNGILRVGGRLKNANIPFNAKNQVLLPHDHFVTKLIIISLHLSCLHGGPKLTESVIRQKYWITNSQHRIKEIISKCVKCFAMRANTMTQIMADLPAARVSMCEKPFTNVAVDYTGEIVYKLNKIRNSKTAKSYIAIFVCMAVKAMHLELVTDLTAVAYIAAFRRFVSRRGQVKNLYSDNATCFTRADKDLQELLMSDSFKNDVNNEFLARGTNWHFSPAGGPHFNGLAEAGVKAVKTFLHKSIGSKMLTYEELSTLLCQIEACVNSRPLCAMSSDPNDIESLTPAHFLVGGSLISPPDENLDDVNVNWLSRWQLVQKTTQQFWKQFQNDYLHRLQMKSKWFENKVEPKVDELVLVKEENVAPYDWPMARILKVHKGDDNLTRVVSLKMKNNVFKRPITKIAPLPIDYDDEKRKEIVSNVTQISKVKKPASVIPIIMCMLLLCTGMKGAAATQPFSIEHFNHPPGLYFESVTSAYMSTSQWNIIAYLKTNSLRTELQHFDEIFETLNNSCNRRSYIIKTCNNSLALIKNRINDVNTKSKLLFVDQKRVKRAALNIVGNIASDLFGVLDSRFRDEYVHDCSKIKNNEEHLLKLIQNNTSIVEATMNILNNNGLELENQSQKIKQLSDTIQNGDTYFETAQNFDLSVIHLLQWIHDFEHQIDTILEVLYDSNKNHMNHILFSTSVLGEQLKFISDHVRNSFVVPGGNDVYKITKIKAYIIENQILFKLTIPLLKSEKFKVFKIFRVPSIHANESWWTDIPAPYMMVANNHQLFQFLDETQLNDCMEYQSDESVICDFPFHFFTAQASHCAWNIFCQLSNDNCTVTRTRADSRIINLGQNNQWIFVIQSPQRILIHCDEQTYYTDIFGEGVLRLNDGCSVRHPKFHIDAQSKFTENRGELILPTLKHFVHFDVLHSRISANNLRKFVHENLTNLYSQLESVKEQSKLPNELDFHDLHHYVLIYLILFVLAIYLIFIYIAKKKKTKTKIIVQPIARAISMPNLSSGEC